MLQRSELLVAARQLRRQPVHAFFAALTMAIGIAAATAIFTVARGVVLRPLPYRDAGSLVALQEFQPLRIGDQSGVAFANLPRYQAAGTFSGVTAFAYTELILSGDGDAERVIGAGADAQLFRTLGVPPLLGRGIEPGDLGDNPAPVAVVGFSLWQRRFHADSTLVGRSIVIDGAPHTVIGVTPEAFEFPRSPAMDRDIEVWVPRRPTPPMMIRRGIRDLTVVARLTAGVSSAQAGREVAALARSAEADNPQLNAGWSARAVDLREVVIGRVRPTIIMLTICVALLVLIACVNTSASALARVTVRRQSFGVRLALGARISQMIALVAAESALLALAAAIMAVPLSSLVRQALIAIAPVALPRQHGIVLDAATLGVTAGVTLITALVSAAGPVSWLRRLDIKDFLGDAARTSAGSRSRSRSLGTFVVVQMSLGTVLLAATLSVYAWFTGINRVNPGFTAAGVTTATIPMRGQRYREGAARAALTTQLLEKVRVIPGVEHAAVASLMPLSGGLMSALYQVAGGENDSSATAALRAVSADFFVTLGIGIVQGRPLDAGDNATAVPVAVVNEAFAKRALGERPALGSALTVTPPGADAPMTFSIVGVSRNAKERDLLGPDTPIIYLSDQQASFPHTMLALRSSGPAPVTRIREALRELDPSLALDDISGLSARVRATYALQFFLLNVLGVFAVSAMILIGVGIYGSVAYVVVADLPAIAVRMALGATPAGIVTSLLRRTLMWALLGCGLGLIVSVAVTRLLGIAELTAKLTGSVAGAVAMLLLALAATWIPARSASSADPLGVLGAQ